MLFFFPKRSIFSGSVQHTHPHGIDDGAHLHTPSLSTAPMTAVLMSAMGTHWVSDQESPRDITKRDEMIVDCVNAVLSSMDAVRRCEADHARGSVSRVLVADRVTGTLHVAGEQPEHCLLSAGPVLSPSGTRSFMQHPPIPAEEFDRPSSS